ncbi:MAG: MBL fold metallo-hydrolase, partial [Vulcanimicrobiaceae bacterium]
VMIWLLQHSITVAERDRRAEAARIAAAETEQRRGKNSSGWWEDEERRRREEERIGALIEEARQWRNAAEMCQHGCIGRFYAAYVSLFDEMAHKERFHLLDGDHTVADGVEVLLVRGHTPGSQIVAVDVPGGRAVVAGDAIRLNENYPANIPNAIHIDVRDAIAAIERVRRLEPISLYTGHDPSNCLDLSGKRTAFSINT